MRDAVGVGNVSDAMMWDDERNKERDGERDDKRNDEMMLSLPSSFSSLSCLVV